MNRIILQIFAAGMFFAVVQALQCYKCHIGFGSLCITSKTMCETGEHCFSGVGKAAGFLEIKMKGCLKEGECNKTADVDFPVGNSTTIYSMTKTCCNTDLCNAAPGLPRTPGLALALASVTAVFLALV